MGDSIKRDYMNYPTIVGVVGIGAVIFLLAFVVPTLFPIVLKEVFHARDWVFPLPTCYLIQFSDTVIHNLHWLLLAMLVIVAASFIFCRVRKKECSLDIERERDTISYIINLLFVILLGVIGEGIIITISLPFFSHR